MAKNINSKNIDYCSLLLPHGKYFFFTRTRNGNNYIYWVNANIIEELKLNSQN
jgi:hypothetical protein